MSREVFTALRKENEDPSKEPGSSRKWKESNLGNEEADEESISRRGWLGVKVGDKDRDLNTGVGNMTVISDLVVASDRVNTLQRTFKK